MKAPQNYISVGTAINSQRESTEIELIISDTISILNLFDDFNERLDMLKARITYPDPEPESKAEHGIASDRKVLETSPPILTQLDNLNSRLKRAVEKAHNSIEFIERKI